MIEAGKIKILLIDSSTSAIHLIEKYFRSSLFEFQPIVEMEQTLEGGLERMRAEEYDVILSDLSLPDSFGLKTFEKIDRISRSVPIIVLTELEDEKVGIEAVQLGAQDFLMKKELNAALLGRSILNAIQRNQLSQKLEKSQERLQQAQELAHLGSFEQNLKTGELIWSEEVYRILKKDPRQPPPSFEVFLKMIHPEDRQYVVETLQKVRREGKRQFIEFRVNIEKGESRYLYSILDPIKNKEGEIEKIFGTTQDVTRQEKMEEQLKEKELRYRMLFQATTDEILVFQVDKDMNPLPFLEVNKVACEMLGYSRNELLKKTVNDIIAADKGEIKRRIKEVIARGETMHESQHLTKEGNRIPIEISAHSFLHNGSQTIISVGRDVRERRKLEREILNISERERQRLGRDMHDGLGQILTGAKLISQALADKLKSNNSQEAEKVQDIVDMIKEADEHARSLARGLVPVDVESNGLASALKELTQKTSKMYSVDIQYSHDENYEPDRNISAVQLYRIAQEAINNAAKHGNATSINVELASTEDHISLHVKDDGNGFPEPEKRGDGMGIRIMYFRAQMAGGNLEIDSERGKGTEITCRIPGR